MTGRYLCCWVALKVTEQRGCDAGAITPLLGQVRGCQSSHAHSSSSLQIRVDMEKLDQSAGISHKGQKQIF